MQAGQLKDLAQHIKRDKPPMHSHSHALLTGRRLKKWKLNAMTHGFEQTFDEFWDVEAPIAVPCEEESKAHFDPEEPRLRNVDISLLERYRISLDNLVEYVVCPLVHGGGGGA